MIAREKLPDFLTSNNFHDCQRKVALPLLPGRSEPGRHGKQGEGHNCGDYLLLHNFNHFGCHLRHCIRNCNPATLRRYYFHCRPRSSLPFVCTKQCIHERETVQVLLGRVAIYTSAGAAEVFGIFTNDEKLKNNLNNISDDMFILGIGH